MPNAANIPLHAGQAPEGTAMSAGAGSTAEQVDLFGLDRTGLEDFFELRLGEQRYRAHQVMKWIHHRHVTDFGQMTDLGKGLPRSVMWSK